jgi:F0F1-type ATP synthase assembly protein I
MAAQIPQSRQRRVSPQAKLAYAVSLAMQLGFLIIAPLVGFIWLGVYLDRVFQSTPALLLVGLTFGIAVTAHETYRVVRPLLISDEPPAPDDPLAHLSGLERQRYLHEHPEARPKDHETPQ